MLGVPLTWSAAAEGLKDAAQRPFALAAFAVLALEAAALALTMGGLMNR